MRIEYVSHACLCIEAGAMRVATDPWWEAPCYARQWNVFPRPVSHAKVDEAGIVLLSHGHADHLHEPTLRTLTPGKTAFYPYYWYGGTPDWLRHMGFANVIEASSGRTYKLGKDGRVTFLVCGQDSVIVIEAGGKVLVNVNDALHSTSAETIDLYCARIRRRWPKIDYVLCGFGGASYFPNVFHAPGKDDRSIGRLREEFFVNEFCRIVAGLEPEIAVPFAADFVLLSPRQRWVNEVRFPREQIPAYFDAHHRRPGVSTRILPMYPGDVLEAGQLHAASPYRAQIREGSLDHLIDEQYPVEASVFASGREIGDAEADAVVGLLQEHIAGQAKFYPSATIEGLRFSVELTDVKAANWYNVSIVGGSVAVIRSASPDPEARAQLRTSHDALLNSITEDWGGDDIIIGYGCEIDGVSPADMPRARIAAELLVRHPRPTDYARRHPLRTLRYVGQTWFATRAKLAAKLRRRPTENRVGTNAWLTEDAHTLRHRLKLPT